jgi:hypothetical protein
MRIHALNEANMKVIKQKAYLKAAKCAMGVPF